MVKINKIYTRTGDRGKTGLGDGSRRLKNDVRVVAYGTSDELNATIGMCLSHASAQKLPELQQNLLKIQNDLFDLGADLCVPENKDNHKSRLRITQEYIDALETAIDHFNTHLKPLNSFILSGGTPLASSLHFARTVARRAERDCLSLEINEQINPLCLVYLNRLSDLLFVLARHANDDGAADVLWQPGIRHQSNPDC